MLLSPMGLLATTATELEDPRRRDSLRRDRDDLEDDTDDHERRGRGRNLGACPGGASSRITLSGLLNALDGISAQEGRLLFATTNRYHTLDPALTRPGRMDLHVEFRLASRYQARELYKRFYVPDAPEKVTEDDDSMMMERLTTLGMSRQQTMVATSCHPHRRALDLPSRAPSTTALHTLRVHQSCPRRKSSGSQVFRSETRPRVVNGQLAGVLDVL